MKALELMKRRLSYLKNEKIVIDEAIKELESIIEAKEEYIHQQKEDSSEYNKLVIQGIKG